jgi:hypothetical protein
MGNLNDISSRSQRKEIRHPRVMEQERLKIDSISRRNTHNGMRVQNKSRTFSPTD